MRELNKEKKHPSFLQSKEWSDFQTKVIERDTANITSGGLSGALVKMSVGYGNYYAYAPHGPYGVFDRESLQKFTQMVRDAAKFKKAFFLRIEPFLEFSNSISDTLKASGFKKVAGVQPEETILLDLSQSEDILLKKMEHDTRYSIRAAARRGVNVVSFLSTDTMRDCAFHEFWDIFSETNTRHGLRSYSEDYYRGLFSLKGDCFSKMYIAYHEKIPVAAAIAVFFHGRATYLYAASKSGFGKLNAPTFILWHIISDAKSMGCTVFDFWGASETKKEWAGVTAFKKSFGGEMVRYMGSWDYIYNKPKYYMYRIAKKII